MWIPKKLVNSAKRDSLTFTSSLNLIRHIPQADSLPFTTILNSRNTSHIALVFSIQPQYTYRSEQQKRMSTVLKIIGLGYKNEADGDAYGDDGYNYAPATCLEGDGDDDDGDYDYAPAA
nr:hypothetical protein Ccrd_009960 [Ipomoea batatas]